MKTKTKKTTPKRRRRKKGSKDGKKKKRESKTSNESDRKLNGDPTKTIPPKNTNDRDQKSTKPSERVSVIVDRVHKHL